MRQAVYSPPGGTITAIDAFEDLQVTRDRVRLALLNPEQRKQPSMMEQMGNAVTNFVRLQPDGALTEGPEVIDGLPDFLRLTRRLECPSCKQSARINEHGEVSAVRQRKLIWGYKCTVRIPRDTLATAGGDPFLAFAMLSTEREVPTGRLAVQCPSCAGQTLEHVPHLYGSRIWKSATQVPALLVLELPEDNSDDGQRTRLTPDQPKCIAVKGADGTTIKVQYRLIAVLMYDVGNHYYTVVRDPAAGWLTYDGCRARGVGQPTSPPTGPDGCGFFPVCVGYCKVPSEQV